MSASTIPALRVCRRCGTEARIACQQAEPICSENGMVTSHSYVDGTDQQALQLLSLRADGWQVDAFGARDRLILVRGSDRTGDPFRGHITDMGVLFGEPVDPARRPQWIGRSLPLSDPVDAWVNGPGPAAPTFEQLQKHVAKLITRLDLVELDGDPMDVGTALQALEQLRGVMTETPAGRYALEEARAR